MCLVANKYSPKSPKRKGGVTSGPGVCVAGRGYLCVGLIGRLQIAAVADVPKDGEHHRADSGACHETTVRAAAGR